MLELIKRGTLAGISAGVAVAVVVLVHDLVRLDTLATSKILARNLIGVPVGEVGMLAWVATILGGARDLIFYAAAHFAAFVAAGIFASWLFGPAGAPGNLLTGALFGAAVLTAALYGGSRLLAPDFVVIPGLSLVLVANAVAGIVMMAQIKDVPEPTPAGAG